MSVFFVRIYMSKIEIKAIIGLGNIGPKYSRNRHNIGFIILDLLADVYNATWSDKPKMEYSEIEIDDKKIILIKPTTFMNNSGEVIPWLLKRGIKAEHILVVHDEMEKKFGTLTVSQNTSHKGHNGLKSLITYGGNMFYRLRCGIGRPEHKDDVARYVLSDFIESPQELQNFEHAAVLKVVDMIKNGIL